MKYEKSFTHELTVPFKYHKKGEIVEAVNITINAPNNRVLPYIAVLEQEYSCAIIKLSKMIEGKDKPESDPKLNVNAEAEQMILILGSGANLQKCYEAFRNILISGNTEFPTCVIDSDQKMTQIVYEKMSPKDTKILLGRYLANFLGFSQND